MWACGLGLKQDFAILWCRIKCKIKQTPHYLQQIAFVFFLAIFLKNKKPVKIFAKKKNIYITIHNYAKFTPKRLHRSVSVMVSLHRLFNAAQSWHKCICTASVIVYFDTMEWGQSRHNLFWLLCSIASLLWNNRKKCRKYHYFFFILEKP